MVVHCLRLKSLVSFLWPHSSQYKAFVWCRPYTHIPYLKDAQYKLQGGKMVQRNELTKRGPNKACKQNVPGEHQVQNSSMC